MTKVKTVERIKSRCKPRDILAKKRLQNNARKQKIVIETSFNAELMREF